MNTKLEYEGEILIVDDSATSRTWTKLRLERAGHRVREAENGQDALVAVADRLPDLILLDVVLPDLDGFELTRRLREDANLSTLPIVLVTALGDIESRVRGLEAGANDFLTKPPDEAELLARVRTLLRLKRNQEELLAEKNKTALLYRVSRELSAELELDPLLARILDLTIESTGATRGSLILLDEWGRAFRNIFSLRGQSASITGTVWDRIVQYGLAGWVIEHQRGALVPDVQEDPRWVVGEETHAMMHAALSVPLIHEGQIAGVLTLTHEEIGYFTTDHLDLLTSVAYQAAVVTERARTYHKEQLRVRQLQLANKVGGEATSILDPTRLLKEVARLICQAFDYYYVDVALSEGDELASQGWGCGREEDSHVPPARLSLSDEGIMPWVARHGKPLLVPDVRRDERYRFVPELSDTVAELAVPLLAGGEVLGVLDVQSDRHGQLTEDEKPLLEILASQITVALVNAHLFEAVERERGRLEAILTGTADAIIATDGAGRITLLNPAAERAFDVSFAGVAERTLAGAIPFDALVEAFHRAQGENRPFLTELTLPDERTLFASISPVAGPKGERGWVAVMQDITHLKELERMKNDFVSTVSHDLRTPLSAVHGFTELLLETATGEKRDFLQRIKFNAEQMSHLVSDLLDLGKIEAGIEAVQVPCQLEELVQEAVEGASFQAVLRNLTLTFAASTIPRPVLGNRQQLRQVLDNLLSNALKYTPAGGTIAVRVWQDSDSLAMEVKDSGIGIPREALPRLFEKFYRVPCPETREIPGTGLGLAIVKAIVERHGGQVWVESELGQGSIFGFSLPAHNGTQIPSQASTLRETPGAEDRAIT